MDFSSVNTFCFRGLSKNLAQWDQPTSINKSYENWCVQNSLYNWGGKCLLPIHPSQSNLRLSFSRGFVLRDRKGRTANVRSFPLNSCIRRINQIVAEWTLSFGIINHFYLYSRPSDWNPQKRANWVPGTEIPAIRTKVLLFEGGLGKVRGPSPSIAKKAKCNGYSPLPTHFFSGYILLISFSLFFPPSRVRECQFEC